MKLARFLYNGNVCFGVVKGDNVDEARGEQFGAFRLTGRSYPLDQVKLLPPTQPSKIVAIGLNYKDYAAELKQALPQEPLLIFKAGLCRHRPAGPYYLPCHVPSGGL